MSIKKDTINQPPFDQDVERPVELDELNFNDANEPSFQDIVPDAEAEEFTIADERIPIEFMDDAVTDDDLSPEILIVEDGSRSPYEPGGAVPHDVILSIVSEDEIGEGCGLDEAELARIDPLDGKPEEDDV